MENGLYEACVENVKDLRKQRNRLNKLVNGAIREKNEADLETFTKVYALLFSAYAEESFLKLIHTPEGFSEEEINVIQQERNLEDKWKKCVELAFKKINLQANLGETANKKRKLTSILDDYIVAPSKARNKIAHGQWKVCLNNDCTGVNPGLTAEVLALDFVKIDRNFSIYEKFQQCILDLLVSPKTHYRDYYKIITDLGEYIESTKNWSIETKKIEILNSLKVQRFQSRG